MKNLQKTNLVNEVLGDIKSLDSIQFSNKIVAANEITKEQLMKLSPAELIELQNEIKNIVKIQDVKRREKLYNENVTTSEKKRNVFVIVC